MKVPFPGSLPWTPRRRATSLSPLSGEGTASLWKSWTIWGILPSAARLPPGGPSGFPTGCSTWTGRGGCAPATRRTFIPPSALGTASSFWRRPAGGIGFCFRESSDGMGAEFGDKRRFPAYPHETGSCSPIALEKLKKSEKTVEFREIQWYTGRAGREFRPFRYFIELTR